MRVSMLNLTLQILDQIKLSQLIHHRPVFISKAGIKLFPLIFMLMKDWDSQYRFNSVSHTVHIHTKTKTYTHFEVNICKLNIWNGHEWTSGKYRQSQTKWKTTTLNLSWCLTTSVMTMELYAEAGRQLATQRRMEPLASGSQGLCCRSECRQETLSLTDTLFFLTAGHWAAAGADGNVSMHAVSGSVKDTSYWQIII